MGVLLKGRKYMTTFGMFYLLMIIAVPILFVFLLIWIYQIKKNSETQVEQNKEIIQLLKKG